jgi:hypothetical protein
VAASAFRVRLAERVVTSFAVVRVDAEGRRWQVRPVAASPR